jgi:CheY-like chemotaxis protein
VEDNEGDIFLTQEALQERKILNQLSVVKNGKEAVDFIFKQGRYLNAEPPELVLLDINLPIKNGHEVLQIIKSDERTNHIPVIMLTTSSSKKDVELANKYKANGYLIKPFKVTQLLKTIASFDNFWLNLVISSKHKPTTDQY